MTSKFQNYVTSTAFSLSLSRAMINNLCLLDQQDFGYVSSGTYNSLYNRGLIERCENAHSDLPENLVNTLSPLAKLTEAGKALIPLLKLSGLYVEYPRGVKLAEAQVTLRHL